MFAFAGASTFPTIQADMKDKTQFPKAALLAMMGNVTRQRDSPLTGSPVLFLIYMPMMAASWGLLGDLVQSSVMDVLCDGPVRSLDGFVSLIIVMCR